MKIRIQLVIEHDDESQTTIQEEVACISRDQLQPATLGLQLAESKQLLTAIQQQMIAAQVSTYIKEAIPCPACDRQRGTKDNKEIVMRTLFGRFQLPSPRLYHCNCQQHPARTFSPLAQRLPKRTTPERHYLQTKWATLMSYGMTVDLLEELLPLHANATTVRRHTHDTAERLESEMVAEEETWQQGLPLIWDQTPEPTPPLTVGIDGGYVHARAGDNRKAGWFEVIVGKSIQDKSDDHKRFAFVHKYTEHPRRHLVDTLQTQGFSMRQSLTFLSDGGDTVRNLQGQIAPYANHLLDWFHVTMRVTKIKQMVKKFTSLRLLNAAESRMMSIKWLLWHGNVFEALRRLSWLSEDTTFYNPDETNHPARFKKLQIAVDEFYTYIKNNKSFIPNYAERYRYGERISTAFVESTVNEVISRRMVKKQQMRWTQAGAHRLLQVRTKTLDGDLRTTYCNWYPGMDRDGALTENRQLSLAC